MNHVENATLNLIIGCMFSGKTTELLRITKRLSSINQNVLLINYYEDKRYSETEMATHDKTTYPCIFVQDLEKVNYDDYSVICINEAQFFTGLTTFCKKALACKKTLYVCGLDGDFKREVFGDILKLIPMSDRVEKLTAICAGCKEKPGIFSKRITRNMEQKDIGSDSYIPLCRRCFNEYKIEITETLDI